MVGRLANILEFYRVVARLPGSKTVHRNPVDDSAGSIVRTELGLTVAINVSGVVIHIKGAVDHHAVTNAADLETVAGSAQVDEVVAVTVVIWRQTKVHDLIGGTECGDQPIIGVGSKRGEVAELKVGGLQHNGRIGFSGRDVAYTGRLQRPTGRGK